MQVQLAGEPGRPGRANEDFTAATPEALVLLDGLGPPDGRESGCSHGTAWYVRRLGVRLLARLTGRADRSIGECLADAVVETAALHGGRCDLAHPRTPAATVVAARVVGEALEYLVLGDSLLVLGLRDGPPRVVGSRRPVPGARTAGPGPRTVAASPRAAEYAETGRVRLAELSAVAALSDGAARFTDLFALGDWSDALRLMSASGPDALIDRVRAAERTDPRCERWPRAQAHDDASAVHARV
ncbi:protein phosphatase 2C domain-containing protein [Kitasatospora sp. NPDC088346]|uniref:protein phosphatase 2C domain-containing protein n=1 Tax=Kitasatospora sp. NPDC088346 TaxID=3364073 RepID=UPI0037F314EE